MKRTTDTVMRSLDVTGGRHDKLLTGLLTLVRFGEAGHPGLDACLRSIETAWWSAVSVDKSRGASEATAEYGRALDGAVGRVMATPTPGHYIGDPCRPPVPGLKSAMTTATAIAGFTDQQRLEAVQAFTQDEGPVPVYPTIGEQGPELGLWPTAGGRVELTGQPDDPAAWDACNPPLVAAELPPSEPAPEPPRTSWWPIDLAGLLDGSSIAQPPTVLARADGQLLWYPGRVNGLIGPSESGKSWIALEACRQVMAAGGRVAYLDFEDTPAGIVGRLLALGCPKAQLLEQFAYLSPEESLNGQGALDLAETLAGVQPVLTVLDGVNAAMSLLGFDLMSNGEATMFYQQVLQPLTKDGAVVTYIDHTPKNDQEGLSRGALGAQAKRAMTTGAAIRCDIVAPFGRGQTGRLKLSVDKDRDGYVRGACEGGSVLGIATLTSDPDTGDVSVAIAADAHTVTEDGIFRPTALMRRVSEHFLQSIHEHPEGLSGNQVREAIRGKRNYVATALEVLVSEGYVSRQAGPRGASIHKLIKPYTGEESPERSNEEMDPRPIPDLSPPIPGISPKADRLDPADRVRLRPSDAPTGDRSDRRARASELEQSKNHQFIAGEWVDITTGEIVELNPEL